MEQEPCKYQERLIFRKLVFKGTLNPAFLENGVKEIRLSASVNKFGEDGWEIKVVQIYLFMFRHIYTWEKFVSMLACTCMQN